MEEVILDSVNTNFSYNGQKYSCSAAEIANVTVSGGFFRAVATSMVGPVSTEETTTFLPIFMNSVAQPADRWLQIVESDTS